MPLKVETSPQAKHHKISLLSLIVRQVTQNNSDFSPLRGDGVTPFSVENFPLTFLKNLVYGGRGGEGGYPLNRKFL